MKLNGVRTSAVQGSYSVVPPLFFGGGELGCDIETSAKKNTKWSKNFCITRNQVAKLFIRRNFATSACKVLLRVT
jgi:hypothetical protein